MTISVSQQVDFLWKKIGYGVTKTDVPLNKDATNESVASSPFIPGHKIWAEADLLPAVIPTAHSAVVHIYSQATLNSCECSMDITATPYRTWFTGLQDWIPIEFGSTYQVKVFLANAGSMSPETSGIQLYAAGTNNNDEWFFDYEAGVLHFIGANLPDVTWTNKKIYISGARYIGVKGLNLATASTIGNITISGDTISSSNNLVLQPFTGNINASGAALQNLAYPTLPTDAATSQFVTDQILALHPNTIYQGDSIMRMSDPTGDAGLLTLKMDGTLVWSVSSTTTTIGNISINGDVISNVNDIHIAPAASKVIIADSSTAFGLPTGTSAERPISPQPGYTRYNSTVGSLEWFNGTDWAGPQSQIASQVLTGDGVATHFNLVQSTHENNVLVTIQGVTQVPGVAYTIAGSVITFNEAPIMNEKIEIRFISQSVTPTLPVGQMTDTSIVDPDEIIVGLNNVVLDSFPIALYRSAKYVLSIVTNDGNAQMAEILMTHNGTVATRAVTSTELTGTGSTIITYTAQIYLGACELLAISSTPLSSIKVQKMYFTL